MSSQASAPSSTRKVPRKTIRLTGTPKTETPSPGTALSQGSGQASRRPSITSLNRPETPASERISDNISYASTSISRANSPPPGRIGSAPTRRVTKNQQKKDRQERAKKAEEEATKKEEPTLKGDEAIVQAPILGRKKKAKKTKERMGFTADSTPAVTRPASPEPQKSTAKEEKPPLPPAAEPAKTLNENKKQIRLPPVAPVEPESNSSVPATLATTDPSQGAPAQSTAADLYVYLKESGELSPGAIDTFFKPVTGASHRFDHNLDPELVLSSHRNALDPNQIAQLDKNEPVVMVLDKNNALLVLPNRRCLKGFTPAQADRYKELHLRGCRAVVSPMINNGVDLLERLMPMYESWGEGPTIEASASRQPESTSTPQLTNRFAEIPGLKSVQPPLSSVNMDASVPRSLLSGAGGYDPNQHQGDKKRMGVEEAEAALAVEKKNTEIIEKKLNALIRKNRRLVLGNGN